jgi:hypothetical protein
VGFHGEEPHGRLLAHPELAMDSYIWTSMISSRYKKGRIATRSVAEVEAAIAKLKTDIDQHAEIEFMDRRAYCLQNSIMFHEADIKDIEEAIKALDKLEVVHKVSAEWAISKAMLETRLANDKRTIEEQRQEFNKCVEAVKNYAFAVKRIELDKELAEAKEDEEGWNDAEKIAEEAKKD